MNTRNVRRFAEFSGILLLVVLMVGSTVAAPTIPAPRLATITLVLKAPPYQFTPTEGGYTAIQAENSSVAGEPSQTLLPRQLVDVALPPDVAWDSLSLTVRDVQTVDVPGTHRLRVAVPDQPGTGPALPARRSIVGLAPAPAIASIAATSQMRKWHLARVDFCPFQYDVATGQLRVVEHATVELRFARTGEAPSTTLLADTVLDDVAAERFVNYAAARDWYPQTDRSNAATYDYVIITTNTIESNSTKLAAFVAHKQARGYSVLVITQDEYGSLTGQSPNGRAEKVRQWLINNYAAYSIKYVLLIGDPMPDGTGTTDLPMKMCWPIRNDPDYGTYDALTDYFFADLTGNWNVDGDAYYGEWEDFTASGGVDLTPEVYVGRIPFYGSYTDLDNILQKTMDYENETNTNWRKSILLPMGFQDTGYDGAPLAQQMWDDYLETAGYSRWRQYQQGSACGADADSIYSSEEELRGGTVVRDRWAANDYGIVCWWGHGSSTSTSVGYSGCWDGTLFSSSQTSSLDDDHPAFTYQNSCTNGYPENTNNLQYAILKRGGIATVSASRVSWFNTGVDYGDFDGNTTNSGIGYEYVSRVVAGLTAGEALYEAKSSMTPEQGTRLMNFYDFNLYGGPGVKLVETVCTPVSGVHITGPLILQEGNSGSYDVIYSPSNATPPVRFAWDNGTMGPTTSYTWTNVGAYTVVVTAINPCGQIQGTLQVDVLEPYRIYLPLALRDYCTPLVPWPGSTKR